MLRSFAIAVLFALAFAPSATAKDEMESLVVCGETRCRELHGPDVLAAASTILARSRLPVGKPAPFYEVMMTFRMPDGSRQVGPALRYVPSAGAVATWQGLSDHQMWYRTDRGLIAVFTRATRGQSPQAARELNRPSEVVGPAVTEFKDSLTRKPIAAAPRGAKTSDDGSRAAYLIAVAIGVVATATLVMLVMRLRRLPL
jgi:hypothetical protein